MDRIHKCMFAGATRASLKNHYRNHSGEKPYKCDVCSYATARSYTLKVHKRIHSDENLYKCNRCSFATNYKNTMERHTSTHDPELLYECNQCSFTSTNLIAMQIHVRYHTGVLRDSNSGSNNVAVIRYSEWRYKCSRCSYASASFKSIQMHIRIHSDELWCDNGKYPKSNHSEELWCDNKYAQSNLNAHPNARENVVPGTINRIIATPPSSYSLSSQSNSSESSNDSVHMRYDWDKKYKFTYANASFKAAQKQMRARSGRLHYSLTNNNAQLKTNHNNASENATTIGESAIIPSNLPLYDQIPFYEFSSTNDLRTHIMDDIYSFDKLPASIVANDIANTNFCDVEPTGDENLDFYAQEQASEEADDNHKNINEDIQELFKNSIVYENLCYADYTEDDFDFDVDE